uniref:Uncharacterized protein n=1 Tax=Arundo donax TaxID=35708 RepID=A0A0A9CM64_ARUDO
MVAKDVSTSITSIGYIFIGIPGNLSGYSLSYFWSVCRELQEFKLVPFT